MRKIIQDGIAFYNIQEGVGVKKGLSDSVKVYEVSNTLRDSTAVDLIAHYPITFAKYSKNRTEIIDLTVTGVKLALKQKITGRDQPFMAVNIL